MADRSWEFLPSIITVEIFSCLPLTDRINASATCKRWRELLFHPTLWKNINFKLKRGVRKRSKYLAETCGKFVTEAVVEFDSQNSYNIREVFNLLCILSSNRNLKKLALRPSSCRIEWPERRPVDVPEQLRDALRTLVENSTCLEHLSLGCIGELTDHADTFLPLLSRFHANKLQTLHISSVKEDPDSYGLINLPCHLIATFSNLQQLGIDYDYLTNHFLEMLCNSNRNVELKKLVIHVHGLDPLQEKITNTTWRRITNQNPSLRVTLNLIHSIDGAVSLLDLLQPAMPLAVLRMFFCGQLRTAGIHFIAQHMNKTFQQLHIVDGISYSWGPAFYDDGSGTDPFVMLAWKCNKLSQLTLIGYSIDHEDVVGISRLRGRSLTKLEIPDCCILEVIETEENTYTNMGIADEAVLEEISNNLGISDWHPLPDNCLHPAIFDPSADAETVYLDILMDDQAW